MVAVLVSSCSVDDSSSDRYTNSLSNVETETTAVESVFTRATSALKGVVAPSVPEFAVYLLGDMEKPTKDQVKLKSSPTISPDGLSIRMAGAHNEVVACQILLQSRLRRDNVRVEIEPLADVENAPVSSLYYQYYHWVKNGSYSWGPGGGGVLPDKKYYPDVLVPLQNPYSPAHEDIAQGFTIETLHGPNQALWLDIFIPKTFKASHWTARILIKQDDSLLATIPLTLEIFPFMLPDERHVDAFGELYRESGVMLDSSVKFKHRPEVDWKFYRRYLQMAHAHRFLALQRADNGPIPWANDHQFPYRDKLNWTDFSMWEKYYGPVLEGSLFTAKEGYAGPSSGTPPSFFMSPFLERWHGKALIKYLENSSGVMSTEDKAYYERNARSFWEMIKQNGWDDKRFFAYILDEVDGDVDVGDRAGSVGKNSPVTQLHGFMRDVQLALDKGTGGKNISLMWTGHTNASIWGKTTADLAPFIRMWSPNGHALDVGYYRKIKKESPGNTVWFYHSGQPAIGNHTVNQTGIDLRTWGLLCWKYQLDGSFWWSVMLFGNPEDPYNNPVYKVGDNRWGNGVLFYPGMKLNSIGFKNIEGPVSSLRMKAYRRGLQDYEYLWLLSQREGNRMHADKLLNEVLRKGFSESLGRRQGDWSRDPEDWYDFRRKAAQSILATGEPILDGVISRR